jgi:hypothetical protein
MERYYFEGNEVLEVWKSFDGSHWIVTEKSGSSAIGYSHLKSGSGIEGWGQINIDEIKNREPAAWEVRRDNWESTGPSNISIEKF